MKAGFKGYGSCVNFVLIKKTVERIGARPMRAGAVTIK
jgi:hypothetical protein